MSTPADSITGGGNTNATPGMSREEIERFVRSMVPAGTDNGKLQELLTDNFTQRETIRTLKGEVEGLKKLVPVEGSVVLTPDQKTEWDAFLAIGKPAGKVVEALKEGEKNAGKVATFEQEKLLGEVAEAEGFTAKEAAVVLATLVGKREIVLEPVEDEQEDEESGEKKKVSVRRAFFKTTDSAGVTTKERVRTAVERDHKAFLSALTTNSAEEDEGREEHRRESGTRSGTPFTRQPVSTSTGGGEKKNVAKSYLGRAYGKKTPAQGARS